MISDDEWRQARAVTRRTVTSTLHCSIASTNDDGTPHVTPIGSVLLLPEPGRAIYFDAFNVRLSANVDRRPDVSILAVDSSRLLWITALLRGECPRPPGIRMIGTVGQRRRSTPDDVARFHRVVGPLLRTRGGAVAWKHLPFVRDVSVDRIESLRMGALTRGVGVVSPARAASGRIR